MQSLKVTGALAKDLKRTDSVFNLGTVILCSLVGIWMMPNQAAMSQSRTFHGVQVSQKFDISSDFADFIKKSTVGSGQSKLSKAKLGQWVVASASQDKYYTYEMQELKIRTTSRIYLIFLLDGTTSDNPKSISFGVDCKENKLGVAGYRVFSSNGKIVSKQLVDADDDLWAAPANSFFQGLVNEVCRLGS